MSRSTPMMFVLVESIEIGGENRSLFATSAYEGLVERVCLVAIVVEFADGNMNTIRVERKNTVSEIRPFATVVIEIGLSDLKTIEEMLLTCHSTLEADWSL